MMDPTMMAAAEQALGGAPGGMPMDPMLGGVDCPTCGQPWPPDLALPPELDPMGGMAPAMPPDMGGGLPFGPGPMG